MKSSKTLAIAANVGVRITAALLNFLLLPVYLKLLGPEGYGIIGLYSTLLVAVMLLDGGLSPALNRQLAQTDDPAARGEALTAAVAMFLCLAMAVALVMWLMAPWIAHHWLNVKALSMSETVWSLRVMGIVFGQQLLLSCYQGALYGLHRQLWINMIALATVVVRSLASVCVLLFFSRTATAFLVTYSIFSAVQIVAMRAAIAPEISVDPLFRRFHWNSSKSLLHATAGIGLMAFLSMALAQADKLTVSRIMPLADFSYYTVGATAAQVPLLFVTAIVLSLFPHFSSLTKSDPKRMMELYHLCTQLVAAVAIPVGVAFALFPVEIVFAWTGSDAIARHVAPILAILGAANGLYVYWEINHSFEVANSRSRPYIVAYAVATAMAVPAMIWATERYGGVGAASVWLVVSAICLFALTPIVMRVGLRGHLVRFYRDSVITPLLVSLPIGLGVWFLVPGTLDRLQSAAVALSALAIMAVASAFAMPDLRARLRPIFRNAATYVSERTAMGK